MSNDSNRFSSDPNEQFARWEAEAIVRMDNRSLYPLVQEQFIYPIFDSESNRGHNMTRLGKNKLEFIDFVIAKVEYYFAKLPHAQRESEIISMCNAGLDHIPSQGGIAMGCALSPTWKGEFRDVEILLGPQRMIGSINNIRYQGPPKKPADPLEGDREKFRQKLLAPNLESAERLQKQLYKMRGIDTDEGSILPPQKEEKEQELPVTSVRVLMPEVKAGKVF